MGEGRRKSFPFRLRCPLALPPCLFTNLFHANHPPRKCEIGDRGTPMRELWLPSTFSASSCGSIARSIFFSFTGRFPPCLSGGDKTAQVLLPARVVSVMLVFFFRGPDRNFAIVTDFSHGSKTFYSACHRVPTFTLAHTLKH